MRYTFFSQSRQAARVCISAFLRLCGIVFFKWILIISFVVLFSCSRPAEIQLGGTAVIAVSADADVLDPIFWSSSSTGTILQFTFPDLIELNFDTSTGRTEYVPSLAKSWEWSNDGRTLTYHLRTDAHWSDGIPITAQDIKFSYRLYANPKIQNVRKSYFTYFFKNELGEVDMNRSVNVENDSTIAFNFVSAYDRFQQLTHTALNFVPKHIYESVDPAQIRSLAMNQEKPVTGKHYTIEKWIRKQEITLARNDHWKIPHQAYLDKIVFRIIPDANTRLVELKTGNVDFVEGLSPEEVREFKSDSGIRIEKQSFRRFDYIGWSHIDVEAYKKNKTIKPNFLFADRKVRQALTMAINREELIRSWLGEYGQMCNGPISPAFKWAFNDTLRPIPYNAVRAKQLLAEAGWQDHDGDGILDKDGKKFEFTITTNTGNSRRAFAMQFIVSELKKIGIEARAQLLESNVFNSGLRNREYDAFIGGMNTAMTIDLRSQIGSNLEKSTFNVCAYQNPVIDSLLDAASGKIDPLEAAQVWKEIQVILNQDQPVTYLFWFDNLVGINNRLKGTHVDILSAYHEYYNWQKIEQQE